jgi:tetratricopeptide (TPR) repeat protein
MDFKRLPFLPLHFFYFELGHDVKRWFWVAMTAVVLAAGFSFFIIENPTFWALEVQEVADFQEEKVKLAEISQHYRSYDLTAHAITQNVSFSAGPMLASSFPTILFWVLQLIGWTFVLTATSMIRSRWSFLFYFVFILFIHFSGLGGLLIPAWGDGPLRYLADFVIALPFLGLAYAFQVNMLKWAFSGRFAVFFLLLGMSFLGVWLQHGWIGLHELATESYFVQIFLAIPFLFFIAKEPTNLLLAIANNRRDPKNRLGTGPVLAIFLVWIMAMLIVVNEYIGFSFLPQGFSWGLKASHIMLVAGVIAVFTSQNHFHFVKTAFTSNTVFTFLIMGGSILTMSHWGLMGSQGDLSFLDSWDRIAAIFLFFVGFGYVIYVYLNHASLIRDKINLYYLLTLSTRYRFMIVWALALVGAIVMEGRTSWSMEHRMKHSYSTQHGDLAQLKLMEGELSEEEQIQLVSKRNNAYKYASQEVVNSPKAFHNRGFYNLTSIELLNETINLYLSAGAFPYAALNAANLYLVRQRPDMARDLLKEKWKVSGHPLLANNLGVLYAQAAEPDSAIKYYQEALLSDLNLSSTYANMAHLYERFDRPEEAEEFLKAGNGLSNPSDAVMANGLAYELKTQQEIVDISIDQENASYPLKFNYLLQLLAADEKEAARQLIKTFNQEEITGDAMILDAFLMFQQDSVDYAISKFQYVDQIFVGKQAESYYTLALAYLERGIPEMAKLYFEKAGHEGMGEGYLYAAHMEMALGELDSAYARLSKVRVDFDHLWDQASKEIATLFLIVSYDNPVYAQTEYDISQFSQEDYIRIGMLSDSIDSYIPALENFRKAIALDSMDHRPYLEMSRIYNRYLDPLAIVNLGYGLQVAPDNPEMLLELSRAYLMQGQADSASLYLAKLPETAIPLEQNKLKASIAYMQGDTATARSLLEASYLEAPMDQEVIIALAAIYDAQGDDDAGNALIGNALSLNTEHPDIWYYYAVFSRAWGQTRDAGFGALRAIELSQGEARKRAIQKEFQSEIEEVIE